MNIQVVDENNNSIGVVDVSKVKNIISITDRLGSTIKAVKVNRDIADTFRISFAEACEIAYKNGDSEPLPEHFYGYHEGIYKYL